MKKGNRQIQKNSLELEKIALEKADSTLESIEKAIDAWKLSKRKPRELEPNINRLKMIGKKLSGWISKVNIKEDNEAQRIERLQEFSSICSSFVRESQENEETVEGNGHFQEADK